MFNIGPEWLILPFFAVGIAALVVWIWTLIDAIQVPDDSMFRAGNRLIWALVIVVGGIIGSIVYLAVGRPSGSVATAPRRAMPPPPPPPPPPSGWGAR